MAAIAAPAATVKSFIICSLFLKVGRVSGAWVYLLGWLLRYQLYFDKGTVQEVDENSKELWVE